MFNKDFYPTPSSVIKMMLDGVKLEHCNVLEPSAGKGDILDYIADNYRHYRPSLYCIESEPDLLHILRENGYRVIGDDFLTYNGCYMFDYIIMNPPFRNGDEHLLKAWEILEEGNIICLLNSETIRNPYTAKRELILKIIEQCGTVEHIGKMFTDAERIAQVECCIVRLKKTCTNKKFSFDFEPVTSSEKMHIDENTFHNQVATNDVIGNMILQYNQLLNQYVEFLKINDGLTFYAQGLLTEYTEIRTVAADCRKGSKYNSFNKFNDTLKANMWAVVLGKMNFGKYLTNSVRANFSSFCKSQGHMDFTKENVYNVVRLLFENRAEIMEQAIIDVFDIFTKYYKENRCHVEGWKTNDSWKVNRKIILPDWVRYGYITPGFDISWDRQAKYSDIDKAMCHLTGTSYENCYTIYDALSYTFDKMRNWKDLAPLPNKTESSFFRIKFYKKGTVHLEFKDLKLWEEFNLRACKGKKWLPDEL